MISWLIFIPFVMSDFYGREDLRHNSYPICHASSDPMFKWTNRQVLIENITENEITNDKKKFSKEKIHGVSLGGWLVLEPWINTNIFDNIDNSTSIPIVDEYTLTKSLGKSKSKDLLEHHWKTYYSEEDLIAIKNHGLNLIRIPVGYWAFELLDDDPYIQGQEKYLDLAIEWASNQGLKVQVDIHGMPGSQNGFDNSGLRTKSIDWLEKEEYMNLTYTILDYVLEKYGKDSRVHSLEFVNEPFAVGGIDVKKLQDFYIYCYDSARKKEIDKQLLFHDGFLHIGWWDWFMKDRKYQNIAIDHHLYEIFSTWHVAQPIDVHIENVKAQGDQMSRQYHASLVGEFSGALTDCTKHINGIGVGSRYDGTYLTEEVMGSCENHKDFSSWSHEFKNDTKHFIKAQMDVFDSHGNGWIFWTFKTDDTIEWDFQKLSKLDMLPSDYKLRAPSTSRKVENEIATEVLSSKNTGSQYGPENSLYRIIYRAMIALNLLALSYL